MRTIKAVKYLFMEFLWDIHDLIEWLAHKHYKIANTTYDFRKWIYLKVFKLEICHFCLKESWDYYCPECLKETI